MKGPRAHASFVLAAVALVSLSTWASGAIAKPSAQWRQSCANIKALALPNARISLAQAIAPAPIWPYPKSLFVPADESGGVRLPFCRVAGMIETEIRFEVWLPRDWNGKFMGVGNGGLAGDLNYPAMGEAMARGYAAASTDTGHRSTASFDDSWISGHAQRVIDFAHRAHHLTAEAAQQIVTAFYGRTVAHAYFSGCSAGGWQGLTEAQRYPGDYDGIITGAPATNFVRLQTRNLWTARLSAADPAGDVPPEKIELLIGAAVARCDAKDGVTDGLISDPQACRFKPKRLRCKDGSGDDCLTRAQIKRVRRSYYGPAKSRGGLTLYPGNAYGAPPRSAGSGEDSSVWANPAIFKMTSDRALTPESFDPDRDIPKLEAELGPLLDSMNPDLSPFAARGGKLIVYHGWRDARLSPYNTVAYYKSVRARMGRKPVDRFLRLYMVPGMGHCGGGPGPNVFDMVAPLEAWVEQDKAPGAILATHLRQGKADRTRPLCPYPQVARYQGSGSADDAANFVCKKSGKPKGFIARLRALF